MATKVQMMPVESSNIDAIGHDAKGLHVRFKGGSTYLYPDVGHAMYQEGLTADSPGRWFRDKIRGSYKHVAQDK